MTFNAIAENYMRARYAFYINSRTATVAKKLALASVMAVFTGLTAGICFKLPFSPVPVTGQVFGVLLSGVVCGGEFGFISQVIYILMGCAGVHWFAGGAGGSFQYLLGPTGGYLFGFAVAAYIIGRFTDVRSGNQRLMPQALVMAAGIGIIYFFGAAYLAFTMKYTFAETMAKGVYPFVLIDLVKAVAAGAAGSFILPKKTIGQK